NVAINMLYWIILNVDDKSSLLLDDLLEKIPREKYLSSLLSLRVLAQNLKKPTFAQKLNDKFSLAGLNITNLAQPFNYVDMHKLTKLSKSKKKEQFTKFLINADEQLLHFIFF